MGFCRVGYYRGLRRPLGKQCSPSLPFMLITFAVRLPTEDASQTEDHALSVGECAYHPRGASICQCHGLSRGNLFMFSGVEKNTFRSRGAVKPRILNKLTFNKSCLVKHGQEVPSRYRPALSTGPAVYPRFNVIAQFCGENLVCNHKTTRGF